MSFFVVFDTCLAPAYYGDVHQVLALPQGAVLRYEYKRYLYTDAASAEIERLAQHPTDLPVRALLMYGQKQNHVKGDPTEPATMLSQTDSIFVPTRSAELVAVGIERGVDRASDVLYLHFQLGGFVSVNAPAVGQLVTALEAAGELPFGDKATQYNWVSLLPAALVAQQNELISEDDAYWTQVVDRLVTAPTQFKDDVFWRVQGLVNVQNGQPGGKVPLADRRTNERVHADRWARDYVLNESSRYAVAIQTYSPAGHGAGIPGGSTVAMTSRDDDQGLLKLSSNPMPIVPNQVEHHRFSIATDAALDTRFAGASIETQVPNWTSPLTAGSFCALTFSIRKKRWRFVLGAVLVLASVALGGYVTGAKPDGPCTAGLLTAAALLLGVGGWCMSQQFKLTK